MKKFLKVVAIMLVVLMMSSTVLVGCNNSNGDDSQTGSDASPAISVSGDSEKEVTIALWQFWNIGDEKDSIKPIIDEFMKNNSKIKVETTKLGWGDGLTKIQTAIGAGTAPDVLELGSTWVGMFSQAGALSDLSKYLTPEIKGKFVNWNLGEFENKVYAFPWAVGTRALAVNYDLFTKAGLDPQKPPKDWNEMIEYAKQIKEKCGVPGFNIEAGDPTGDYQTFMDFVYSAGGNMIVKKDDKYVAGIDSEETKKAIKFYNDIKPYSTVDNEANATLAFKDNKLGMMIIGSYLTAGMQKEGQAVKNWGYEVIPTCPETGKTLAFNGAEVLTIPEQSKNKDAALKLLTFLADEKNAMKICEATGFAIVPSTKNAGELDIFKNPGENEAAKRVVKFIDIAKNGNTWAPPLHKNVEDIGMRISTMVQEIFLNKKDADKAMKDAANDINKLYLK